MLLSIHSCLIAGPGLRIFGEGRNPFPLTLRLEKVSIISIDNLFGH